MYHPQLVLVQVASPHLRHCVSRQKDTGPVHISRPHSVRSRPGLEVIGPSRQGAGRETEVYYLRDQFSGLSASYRSIALNQ